ncbi:HTH-type transcriptional regulator GbpR [compost metagenome]
MQRFLHEYPKVQVELHEGTMNALLDRLERGQLDLVVGRLDNCTPRSTLRSETLYSERLRIVARPGHPLVSRDDLEWAELRTFDWITWPDGTPIRANFDAMLAMAGQQPLPYRVESMSLISNLWLLQYSDMLSIASDKVAEHFRTRGLVEPLRFDPECCGVLGMCWRDEAFPEPHLETLLGCMREAVSD